MKTFRKTTGPARAKVTAARHGGVVTGLALAVLTITIGPPRLTHAGTSSDSPVIRCSDFGCEK